MFEDLRADAVVGRPRARPGHLHHRHDGHRPRRRRRPPGGVLVHLVVDDVVELPVLDGESTTTYPAPFPVAVRRARRRRHVDHSGAARAPRAVRSVDDDHHEP